MQFSLHIKEKNIEDKYDCASCKGQHRLCLLLNDTINANYMKVDVDDVTAQTIHKVYDEWRTQYGEAPQWFILRELSICPLPIITVLSNTMHRYYNMLGGIGTNSFKDLAHIPAFYVEAVNIINNEEMKATKRNG